MSTPHDPSRWTAAILAGGRARRYGGQDKSTLVVGGVSILNRQLAVLCEVASSILIVSSRPDTASGGIPVVSDELPGAGALGGVLTALVNSTTTWTLVLACDMPFVSVSFLAHLCSLAEREPAEAVVPRSADGWQPLCAAYSRGAINVIRERLRAGALKATGVLNALRVRELTPAETARFDPLGLLFFNVNTPEDYRRALELARQSNP